MAHWGKAGQRLTPEQVAERERQRQEASRRAAAISRPQVEKREADARRAWEAGLVRPDMLTLWLDYRGLDGPGVDAACGVREPTVDLWEAGRVYPSWEQLLALAKLCQVPVWKFTEDPVVDSGQFFLCGGRRNATPEPRRVVAFDPMALAAAGLDPYPTATLKPPDEHGQGRLL